MSDQNPPSLDPVAARRWKTIPAVESPWLHEEVARRMQERLDYIKATPQRWLHCEPLRGGVLAHRDLIRRYPGARDCCFEATPRAAAQASRILTPSWWTLERWRSGATQAMTQLPRDVDMVWSNMALHMDSQPQQTMAQWHDALNVDGFLMFSCLGPDTLKELHAVYQAIGWPAPSHAFTDMHDLGDMLVAAGFAEPVMSMECLTLTFTSPERLLQELRGLGRNLHLARFPGLRTRRWRARLQEALTQHLAGQNGDGQLALSFEIIFGHAFKPAPRLTVNAESSFSLQQMRDVLADNRKPRALPVETVMPDNRVR